MFLPPGKHDNIFTLKRYMVSLIQLMKTSSWSYQTNENFKCRIKMQQIILKICNYC